MHSETALTPQSDSTSDTPAETNINYSRQLHDPELDKIPLYTPYVVSYDRKKTENGLVESAAYLKRYYSMIDAEIYFGNEYVEDIVSIEWSIQQQTMPLFGYHSYICDEFAQGSRIIYGTFTINFTSPNYLFKLLESINEEEQTLLHNYAIPCKERIVDGVDQGVKNVNTRFDDTINYPNHNEIWTKAFDIDAVFGHKQDSYIDPVHILIECVKITNSNIGMSADSGGRPNIFETYNFIARDITTRDYKAPYSDSE